GSCRVSTLTPPPTKASYILLGACRFVNTTSLSVSSSTSHKPGLPRGSGQKYSPSGSKMIVPTGSLLSPRRGTVGPAGVEYSVENKSFTKCDLPKLALSKTKLRRDMSVLIW